LRSPLDSLRTRAKNMCFLTDTIPNERNTHFKPHYPRHTLSANKNQPFQSNGVITYSHGSLTNPTAKDLFPYLYKHLDSRTTPPSCLLAYSVLCQRRKKNRQPCLEEERVARGSEREVPNDTVRFWGITFRESPSPLFAVLLDVVVLNVSVVSSTKKPVVFSRSFSRTWFATLSPTPSMLAARPSPPWTLSTPSRGKAGPSTVSVVRELGISSMLWKLGFLII